MNILWITNCLLPEATEKMDGATEIKGSGGWLLALSEGLLRLSDIKLAVATVDSRVSKLTRIKGEKIQYYVLPGGRNGFFRINHSLEPYWREVRDEFKPNVIHLHGTEYTHGLAWLEACGANHVCVSIQGMVGIIGRYYTYGLQNDEIRIAKIHHLLFNRGIIKTAHDFCRRGECEEEILQRVHYLIGRTSWDLAHTWAVNPHAKYFEGGEILRQEFYGEDKWNYFDCNPYSIFLSQAGYPIKGLTVFLRAMDLVLKHYPNTHVRIAGNNPSLYKGFRSWVKNGDYSRIVKNNILKYNLNDRVEFIGPLNAKEMKDEYLKSNVFVCPSSIENSPNSLCEAQILGVPVIGSYVGGIPDLMRGEEEYLYRFEEYEMLAQLICRVFKQKDKVNTEETRQMALNRHDSDIIVNNLIKVYQTINAE